MASLSNTGKARASSSAAGASTNAPGPSAEVLSASQPDAAADDAVDEQIESRNPLWVVAIGMALLAALFGIVLIVGGN